jgi:hypothetical protein
MIAIVNNNMQLTCKYLNSDSSSDESWSFGEPSKNCKRQRIYQAVPSPIAALTNVVVNLPLKHPYKTVAVSKTMTFKELLEQVTGKPIQEQQIIIKSALGLGGLEYGPSLVMSEVLLGPKAEVWFEKEKTHNLDDFF